MCSRSKTFTTKPPPTAKTVPSPPSPNGGPSTSVPRLEAPSISAVKDPQGYAFRAFAQQTKSDLKALAACIRGSRQTLTRDEVARITAPTLVAVGSTDTIAGSAQELAMLMLLTPPTGIDAFDS